MGANVKKWAATIFVACAIATSAGCARAYPEPAGTTMCDIIDCSGSNEPIDACQIFPCGNSDPLNNDSAVSGDSK